MRMRAQPSQDEAVESWTELVLQGPWEGVLAAQGCQRPAFPHTRKNKQSPFNFCSFRFSLSCNQSLTHSKGPQPASCGLGTRRGGGQGSAVPGQETGGQCGEGSPPGRALGACACPGSYLQGLCLACSFHMMETTSIPFWDWGWMLSGARAGPRGWRRAFPEYMKILGLCQSSWH